LVTDRPDDLETELERLKAEQERLRSSNNDLEAWKRHIEALVEYQARVERRQPARRMD